MKSFLGGKICLTLVTIQKDSKFCDKTNKKVIGKIKDEFDGAIVIESCNWKNDGKECNTAPYVKRLKKTVIKKILIKKIVMTEKGRDNWKRLWSLEKIVMIGKDCD